MRMQGLGGNCGPLRRVVEMYVIQYNQRTSLLHDSLATLVDQTPDPTRKTLSDFPISPKSNSNVHISSIAASTTQSHCLGLLIRIHIRIISRLPIRRARAPTTTEADSTPRPSILLCSFATRIPSVPVLRRILRARFILEQR